MGKENLRLTTHGKRHSLAAELADGGANPRSVARNSFREGGWTLATACLSQGWTTPHSSSAPVIKTSPSPRFPLLVSLPSSRCFAFNQLLSFLPAFLPKSLFLSPVDTFILLKTCSTSPSDSVRSCVILNFPTAFDQPRNFNLPYRESLISQYEDAISAPCVSCCARNSCSHCLHQLLCRWS